MKNVKVIIGKSSCCGVEAPECCDMKGFLSFLVLWIISKNDMRGCEISSELERRRGSKPSPGTVYPVLKELKEKGLIESDERKIYTLSEKGKEELNSALHHFSSVFYDAEEMFKCCISDTEPQDHSKKD